MLTEILISGFGGQGVLFSGKLLAYAALSEGKELSWLPSYGPEMRGGTANCSVCLSNEPIGSPLVTQPDILIAMNEPSVKKFESSVKPGGIMFLDSSLTERKPSRNDIVCFEVPASEIARNNSLTGMSNIVLLGKVLKECHERLTGIGISAVETALNKIIPPKRKAMAEKNLYALRLGYQL